MALLIGYPGPTAGDTTKVFTTQDNPLGARGFDALGNEYIFLKGVASLAVGDWVTFVQSTGVTTRIPTTTVSGMLAVACAAAVAGNFGWFQIYGTTPTTTAITTGSTDGATLTVGSGTAGRVTGGGAVTTKNVFGAVAVGVSASNQGAAFLNYPFAFGSSTI